MTNVTLSIDGMSCGHCVARVTRALELIPGVDVQQVVIGQAKVDVDPAQASTALIIERLTDEGYPSREVPS
jgi:copper chaperone CopZ